MPLDKLARKFSRAKWEKPSFIQDDDIPADAVTGCLRIIDNKLSFWECTHDSLSIEEVVLALATGPKYDTPDKMHIVVVDREDLLAEGLCLVNSPGDTAVVELRSRHLDMTELTLVKLVKLARITDRKVKTDANCHLFTRMQVARIIKGAISHRRIKPDELHPKLLAELERIQT
jgi:hypothetical protein